MICLNESMRAYGRTINIFIATETVTDELEGTVSLVYQNPIPMEGMLEDLSAAKAVYMMPGIQTDKRKIFITDKDNRSLIEASHKIEIDNEVYYGYKNGNGDKIAIKEEGDFIRVFLARKLYD